MAAETARLRIDQILLSRAERCRRYQRILQAMPQHSAVDDVDDPRPLHLNPANCWLRLDGQPNDGAGPADQPEGRDKSRTGGPEPPTSGHSALFFLVEGELRGIRMNLFEQALINALADYQPCTVRQWSEYSRLLDPRNLVVLAGHLADIGLVAWG